MKVAYKTHHMCPRKQGLPYYTDEELIMIKEQWLKDKKQIDANPHYEYYVDRWFEYKKHLNNNNLQALFGHAAHLYRHLQENALLFLYRDEDTKIVNTFRRIIADGYYSKSREEEKRRRRHLANIVSRQTYRKIKKKF